ncbi:MAG: CBS domain-containing protein [Rhodospirillaceae bacterium]|jgi:CBS domain-containing protein|nr:CBS domain-containing protein [Rhodospirillaceae bacterium]MBT4046108.1 CBS domain-containing protein [Rhodospirillaceae bacterium]MBT4687853.1 CBS domain-containing protein [Rhodospirillaceae bacterium]MBT5080247.1 CBS domain-containing protein [Rhodospirillaceae bacterium]MBT5527054.1 CBS domain-containing protein [Rhodospirillaceae bacterium]
MHVERILAAKGRKVFSVTANETIGRAAEILNQNRIGAILVCDAGGHVEGILSERDIVRGMAQMGPKCLSTLVAELMTRDVVFCLPEDNIDTIMSVMTERRTRHLPVMRDGQLMGIISIGDVVKFRMEEIENEADAMRQYIATG